MCWLLYMSLTCRDFKIMRVSVCCECDMWFIVCVCVCVCVLCVGVCVCVWGGGVEVGLRTILGPATPACVLARGFPPHQNHSSVPYHPCGRGRPAGAWLFG